MPRAETVAAIVIGRNEGARLVRCLTAACDAGLSPLIYVDSGSTDDSVAAAQGLGAQVVALDMARPFTAARARNEGFAALQAQGGAEFVQFIDGDCELQPGWVAAGLAHLRAHPQAAIAAGRVRERFPQRSVYNRLCDAEWDTPVGQAASVGGIFMARAQAIADAGGFDDSLIAGEEPELCARLRHAGWTVWRLADEMVLHDAAMTRFGQWWTRMRRSGHAAAEAGARTGPSRDPKGAEQVRRALLWSFGVPLAALIAVAFIGPWGLLILLLWPVQVVRLARRRGGGRAGLEWGFFTTLAKLPEALGGLRFHWGRLTARRQGLIEYK